MHDESQTERENGKDFHILRLGYYDIANLLPLLYPLEAGWTAPPAPWRLELVRASPHELAQAAIEKRLDAAFLSPVHVAGNGPKLGLVGGWGLCVEGRIDTAALLAPQRLDLMDGAKVSISPEAADSTAEHLLKLLLKPYYDIALEMVSPGEPGYDPQGTRLVYGDRAATEATKRPKNWVADDLGVAWYVLTGLPMVWQILVGRRDLETVKPGAIEQIQALLKASQRSAREQQASVLEVAAGRLGFSTGSTKELFARQRFTLNEADKKGLARFLDFAAREGLIPG